ncbi:MAG: virulence RhuM family protein [Flavobacteriaceae bacterium]|nr:virulence RhuM family protein [Flavobacteriaceae bacterium]
MKSNDNSEIIIYKSEDGRTKIDVRMENNTLWLTQAQIAQLFGRERSVITKHLRNIFDENELEEKSNVQNLHIANSDKPVSFYSLDAILAVGYRVKSLRGTQFRQWATTVLHEYLQKGFAMNDDLLKKAGNGDYWRELLERIRDIRSSEKMFYRQVLDLYATSVDYDPRTPEALEFFKIVQNKIHFAAHGHTAAEVIAQRANAELPFMGMSVFLGKQPTKGEIGIAKNYLSSEELAVLNRMVSAFFDLAELRAMQHQPMYMRDWVSELDDFAKRYGKGILSNAGTVSRQSALEKASAEYEKYRQRTIDELSAVEQDFLEIIKNTQKKLEGKTKRNKN